MIPVEKNKEYIVDIEALSSEGSGIARVDSYTLFVPETIPGDKVKILCLKTKSSYGYGKVLEILSPANARAIPPCPHFSKCGGCQLMMLSYQAQLDFKKKCVEDALKRLGGIDVPVDIIGMVEPFRYRNKMVFPFSPSGDWGFYRERSHDVIPLNDCLLGGSLNAQIMNAVTSVIKKHRISVYDEKAHKGIMRRAFLRTSGTETMVVLSANSDTLPHEAEFIAEITAVSPKITSIILNTNKERTNLVLGSKNRTLFGKDALSAELLELSYEVSPRSFFQVNPKSTEVLYKTALDFADIKSDDKVLDIYCGIGTISLSAAKIASSVTGIEIVPEAIENAKENAKRNGIKNAEFYCGAAADVVPELLKDAEPFDIVILDPPRKGSDELTLSAIADTAPSKIVYVSCNPATLARDAKFLASRGYTPRKATAVDMFPHTTHVECCLLLCRII